MSVSTDTRGNIRIEAIDPPPKPALLLICRTRGQFLEVESTRAFRLSREDARALAAKLEAWATSDVRHDV